MTDQQPEDQPTPDQTEEPEQTQRSDQDEGTGDAKQELDTGEPGDIGDDRLPEDLQPTEDNPLARHPGQTGDEDDQIGADREDDPDTAPLSAEEADYGSGAGGGSGSSSDDDSDDDS